MDPLDAFINKYGEANGPHPQQEEETRSVWDRSVHALAQTF